MIDRIRFRQLARLAFSAFVLRFLIALIPVVLIRPLPGRWRHPHSPHQLRNYSAFLGPSVSDLCEAEWLIRKRGNGDLWCWTGIDG